MAATPEGAVKRAVKDVLKEMGIWFYMPVQNGMGVVGIHDFICCCRGFFFTIETKAPPPAGSKKEPFDLLTPNQKRVFQEVHDHGGKALIIFTTDKQTIRATIRMAVGAAIAL